MGHLRLPILWIPQINGYLNAAEGQLRLGSLPGRCLGCYRY